MQYANLVCYDYFLIYEGYYLVVGVGEGHINSVQYFMSLQSTMTLSSCGENRKRLEEFITEFIAPWLREKTICFIEIKLGGIMVFVSHKIKKV